MNHFVPRAPPSPPQPPQRRGGGQDLNLFVHLSVCLDTRTGAPEAPPLALKDSAWRPELRYRVSLFIASPSPHPYALYLHPLPGLAGADPWVSPPPWSEGCPGQSLIHGPEIPSLVIARKAWATLSSPVP